MLIREVVQTTGRYYCYTAKAYPTWKPREAGVLLRQHVRMNVEKNLGKLYGILEEADHRPKEVSFLDVVQRHDFGQIIFALMLNLLRLVTMQSCSGKSYEYELMDLLRKRAGFQYQVVASPIDFHEFLTAIDAYLRKEGMGDESWAQTQPYAILVRISQGFHKLLDQQLMNSGEVSETLKTLSWNIFLLSVYLGMHLDTIEMRFDDWTALKKQESKIHYPL